jgi:hypothetical protein
VDGTFVQIAVAVVGDVNINSPVACPSAGCRLANHSTRIAETDLLKEQIAITLTLGIHSANMFAIPPTTGLRFVGGSGNTRGDPLQFRSRCEIGFKLERLSPWAQKLKHWRVRMPERLCSIFLLASFHTQIEPRGKASAS